MNFFNLTQTDTLAQLLIEKSMHTRREFFGEDCAGVDNIATDAESNAAVEAGSNGWSTVRG